MGRVIGNMDTSHLIFAGSCEVDTELSILRSSGHQMAAASARRHTNHASQRGGGCASGAARATLHARVSILSWPWHPDQPGTSWSGSPQVSMYSHPASRTRPLSFQPDLHRLQCLHTHTRFLAVFADGAAVLSNGMTCFHHISSCLMLPRPPKMTPSTCPSWASGPFASALSSVVRQEQESHLPHPRSCLPDPHRTC